MTKVYRLTYADKAATERISHLLNSLRSAPVTLEHSQLQELLTKDSFHLFVAEDEEGVIIGMLTLTSCSTLAGDKLWIEDVIVDESRRGHGTGRALLREAISYARNTLKATSITLTSNPSRVQARSLYRSEGFEEYNTGVFRKLFPVLEKALL
ncbi:MAG: GNAT family N-acetyltransferase [Bacteroidales bacterium]|nr:GNAT family N-acetyltransferase [Bacteroidales bacterium]